MVSAETIEECFNMVIERKFQDAKNMVENMRSTKSNRVLGASFALEGLIAMQSAKPATLPFDPQKDLVRFRKVLNEMESSVWSDDFDRGYFSTWRKFVKYASDRNLPTLDQSVVKNPSEEEEHDKRS